MTAPADKVLAPEKNAVSRRKRIVMPGNYTQNFRILLSFR